MALEKRISELTAKVGAIEDTDLMVISDYNGATYDTKKVTGTQLKPFKTYLVSISQSGTSAPTVNYEYSELTSTITWAYITIGVYEATLSVNELTNDKTFFQVSLGAGTMGFYSVVRTASTKFRVRNYDIAGTSQNSMLLDTQIEIKIIK
jgi:hypothetical protein